MRSEAAFQAKIAKFLRGEGFLVIKNQASASMPKGFPDLSWWYKRRHGFLEVKASADSEFQPLQPEWIAKLSEHCLARVVYPENWEEIKALLMQIKEEEDGSK